MNSSNKSELSRWRSLARVVFLLTLLILLAGCSVLKASPAPDSGFLPHGDQLAPLEERSPFHGTWFADRIGFYKLKKEYSKLVVMPVDTSYLESKIRALKISEERKIDRIEDLREIARYMQQRFRNAMLDYPSNPIKLVDHIEPQTLVFETAIVELNPTNPVVNTVGTAAGFFVPGGGLIKYAGKGSIAIESIIRDGDTGQSLVEFKDRQSDKAAPITVRDYQEFAHSRVAIDEWSETFAELAATPYEHRVRGPLPFTLNPL